ncbi:hypothetical protein NP493_109g02011 [Ridgeia piscesae]|uniref:Uncharacterized protein n=1 Tax=Ridgeia piscesae TaxID=27915 RepID=A0AAD9P6Y7_RIDPI|nr:hypothetical protein NP493_109g02011 [Ridgeia piscesae]
MDQDGVRTCKQNGVRPPKRLFHAVTSYERLYTSDDAEVRVLLRVLARLYLQSELVHVRQWLGSPLQQRVSLREQFVLYANPCISWSQ